MDNKTFIERFYAVDFWYSELDQLTDSQWAILREELSGHLSPLKLNWNILYKAYQNRPDGPSWAFIDQFLLKSGVTDLTLEVRRFRPSKDQNSSKWKEWLAMNRLLSNYPFTHLQLIKNKFSFWSWSDWEFFVQILSQSHITSLSLSNNRLVSDAHSAERWKRHETILKFLARGLSESYVTSLEWPWSLVYLEKVLSNTSVGDLILKKQGSNPVFSITELEALQRVLSTACITSLSTFRWTSFTEAQWDFFGKILLKSNVTFLNLGFVYWGLHDSETINPSQQAIFVRWLGTSQIAGLRLYWPDLSHLNELEWVAFCHALTTSQLISLSLKNNPLNTLTVSQWKTFGQSVSRSSITTLDIQGNDLEQLNETQWRAFCEPLNASELSLDQLTLGISEADEAQLLTWCPWLSTDHNTAEMPTQTAEAVCSTPVEPLGTIVAVIALVFMTVIVSCKRIFQRKHVLNAKIANTSPVNANALRAPQYNLLGMMNDYQGAIDNRVDRDQISRSQLLAKAIVKRLVVRWPIYKTKEQVLVDQLSTLIMRNDPVLPHFSRDPFIDYAIMADHFLNRIHLSQEDIEAILSNNTHKRCLSEQINQSLAWADKKLANDVSSPITHNMQCLDNVPSKGRTMLL